MSDNDMSIDIENFDFNMLVDDVADNTASPSNSHFGSKETVEYKNNAEYSEEFDDEDFDEEEEEFNEEDYAQDEEDEEAGNEAQDAETVQYFAENFSELPDDLELNIDGQKFTKSDMMDVVRQREEVYKSHRDAIEFDKQCDEISRKINGYIQSSMSETESKLNEVIRQLNNADSLTAENERILRRKHSQLLHNQQVLLNNAKGYMEEQRNLEEQLVAKRINQTVVAMKGTQGFNGLDSIRSACKFAEDSGVSSEAILKGMSPALMQVFMDAQAFRNGKASKKARLDSISAKKQSTAPRSAPSRQPKRSTGKVTNAARARALQDLKSGKMKTEDAFDFLID